jgi:hypothetical protein
VIRGERRAADRDFQLVGFRGQSDNIVRTQNGPAVNREQANAQRQQEQRQTTHARTPQTGNFLREGDPPRRTAELLLSFIEADGSVESRAPE